MYTHAIYGKEGDVTTMTFPSFNATSDISVRFSVYHKGKSLLKVTANIILSVGLHSAQVNYQSYYSIGWNEVCLDLAKGEVSELAFSVTRGADMLAMVAIDDIVLDEKPCKSE